VRCDAGAFLCLLFIGKERSPKTYEKRRGRVLFRWFIGNARNVPKKVGDHLKRRKTCEDRGRPNLEKKIQGEILSHNGEGFRGLFAKLLL